MGRTRIGSRRSALPGSRRTRAAGPAWATAIAVAASFLGACAKNRAPEAATPAPEPAATGPSTDRGDRFVLLTPIGQLAPEDAPVLPPSR